MKSKICTICHKNESVWDNFGGICGQCMIEKELRENTKRHDSELLDKFVARLKDYFVIPHDIQVIERMAKEMKAEVENDSSTVNP